MIAAVLTWNHRDQQLNDFVNLDAGMQKHLATIIDTETRLPEILKALENMHKYAVCYFGRYPYDVNEAELDTARALLEEEG